MNLDITYCTSKKCNRKDKCFRWIKDMINGYHILIFDPYRPKKKCPYYGRKV